MMPSTLRAFRLGDWSVVAATDQGKVRQRQEDAWSVLPGVRFAGQTVDAFAVFDGLGGEPRGQEAARAANENLEDTLGSARGIDEVLPALERFVDASGGMTTAAMGIFPRTREGRGWAAAAGDSAAYRGLRGRPDLLIEKDRAGGAITSCLGGGLLTAHSAPLQFGPGETFLFCTDGVDEVVGSGPLSKLLQVPTSMLEPGVVELFAEIERRGAPDNATLIVARWR
jgi:serine/threonine protein phosphatase PrpC